MSDTEDGADAPDDGADVPEDGTDAPDEGDDGFDKEAEREKLREQYERDRKRREATQQMSDLLLKGATMTDQHCDDCGSPIFRYEGEAFCPTCAGTRGVAEGESGQGQQAQGGQSQEAQGGQRQQAQGGQSEQPQGREGQQGDQRRQARGGQPQRDDRARQPDSGAEAGGRAAAAGADAPSGDDGGDADADGLDETDLEAARRRLDERAGTPSGAGGGPGGRRRDPPVGDSPVRQGEVPSMAQTRASLRRAIVSLSEQAAQSDDPNRAHDLLKGAREASEALAALEGTTGE